MGEKEREQNKEVAEIKAIQHIAKVQKLKEEMNKIKRDQDSSQNQQNSLMRKAEKDTMKHKIQIMKMKKSMTRLELSIADSTNQNNEENENQYVMTPTIKEDDDHEWNEHDLQFSDDDEVELKNASQSLGINDYMSMDVKVLRKELLKLAKPKLIKLCKQSNIALQSQNSKMNMIQSLLEVKKVNDQKQNDHTDGLFLE